MSKQPITPINNWYCETCNRPDVYTHPEMVKHLEEVHKLTTKGLKIRRSMVLHVDSADSYSSTYEVTIPSHPDIKLTNFTLNPRKKNYGERPD